MEELSSRKLLLCQPSGSVSGVQRQQIANMRESSDKLTGACLRTEGGVGRVEKKCDLWCKKSADEEKIGGIEEERKGGVV